MMEIRPVLKGLKSYLPLPKSVSTTRGTDNSRYCYSVWMRHLIMANAIVPLGIPKVVAELGPGDSLGIGLAALLSGVEKYYGLDIVDYTSTRRNLDILEGLLPVFNANSPVPDDREFPNVQPKLRDYSFPAGLFPGGLSPSEEKVRQLKDSLSSGLQGTNSILKFICPWSTPQTIEKASLDFAFSQAVLEHVDELEFTYQALNSWLKPGAYMTHVIDFTSHSITPQWNGHWTYPPWMFKAVKGTRPYLLNREPLSTHLELLAKCGFEVVETIPNFDYTGLPAAKLSRSFSYLSETDVVTKTAFVMARKKY